MPLLVIEGRVRILTYSLVDVADVAGGHQRDC